MRTSIITTNTNTNTSTTIITIITIIIPSTLFPSLVKSKIIIIIISRAITTLIGTFLKGLLFQRSTIPPSQSNNIPTRGVLVPAMLSKTGAGVAARGMRIIFVAIVVIQAIQLARLLSLHTQGCHPHSSILISHGSWTLDPQQMRKVIKNGDREI